MDETQPAVKDAEDDDSTSIVKVREAKAMLEDITARRRNQPDAARVSWLQRLLNWFRRG